MSHDVKDFEKEVVQRSATIPVLVDFWAEWCGPCRVLTPVLEKIAERHKDDFELKKVNTEELPDVAGRYDIRSIPNVKLFSEGNVINEFVGALPESSIERWLQTALPDKYAKQLDSAEQLVRQQRYDEARKLLEPIIAASPNHERARSLLGLAFLSTDRKRAVELVSIVEEGSKYSLLAESIRNFDQLIARLDNPTTLPDSAVKEKYLGAIKNLSEGKFDEALQEFIGVIREDRYYDDDGSRKACIAIFKYLGEENEISVKHRRDFGNALFT
jgi:putative thioredoxin